MADASAHLFDTKAYKYNLHALNVQQEAALYHRLSVHLAFSWCSQQAMMMMPPMPTTMPYGGASGWFPGATGASTMSATNMMYPTSAPVDTGNKQATVTKPEGTQDNTNMATGSRSNTSTGLKAVAVPANPLPINPNQSSCTPINISTGEDDLSCDDLFKIFNDLGGQDAGELSSIVSNGSDDSGALNNGLGGAVSLSRRGSLLTDTHASSLPLAVDMLSGASATDTPHHVEAADPLMLPDLDLDMYMDRELAGLKEPAHDLMTDLQRAASGTALPAPAIGCTGWPAPIMAPSAHAHAAATMRTASAPAARSRGGVSGMGAMSGSGTSSPSSAPTPKVKGGVKKHVAADQHREKERCKAILLQAQQQQAAPANLNNIRTDELDDHVGDVLGTNSLYALGWMEDVTVEGLTA